MVFNVPDDCRIDIEGAVGVKDVEKLCKDMLRGAFTVGKSIDPPADDCGAINVPFDSFGKC